LYSTISKIALLRGANVFLAIDHIRFFLNREMFVDFKKENAFSKIALEIPY
jgi:hypothetical protein